MNTSKYNAIVSKNLKRIAYQHEKTQIDIARDLKISKATVSSWMNGTRLPRMDKVDLLCQYFGVTREDIMEESPVRKSTSIKIPVYGRVRAGIPKEAIEDIIDTEEIDPDMVKDGSEYMALKIRGGSMEPKISDGDVVIVRKQPDVESGQIAIVMVNKEDATCKRVRKYRDGIELVASNPAYEPVFYSNEQIASLPVTILGRVVELRAKF